MKSGQKLNHLLYMDDHKLYMKTENELKTLVSSVDDLSKDMSFGISKCAKVIVLKGKFEPAERIPTSTGWITDVGTDKGYKYLSVLQTNGNMQNKIKDETKQTYIKRNKYALKSKLNVRSKIQAINSYAIPIISYDNDKLDTKRDSRDR